MPKCAILNCRKVKKLRMQSSTDQLLENSQQGYILLSVKGHNLLLPKKELPIKNRKSVSEVGFEPTPPFGDQNTQPSYYDEERLFLSLAP